MLSVADTRIEDVLPLFSDKGVDVALLVPTDTGIEKSIMDATTPVRQFLQRNHIHNYDEQEQGQDSKVLFPAFFVNAGGLVETTTSLYRPVTKNGDPRIWFGGLKRYCSPKNLLGVVTNGKALFVFNLSNPAIVNSVIFGGIASVVLNDISSLTNAISNELLEKLRVIHGMGFVETVTRGDTGIGMTLESLLGIPPNPDKAPDYKGIEIKSSRKKARNQNRVNLFSQVPNWKESAIKTAQELLKTYGYVRDRRLQLYCTVAASRPNSQGLFFEVDENKDVLHNKSVRPDNRQIQDVVLWEIESLRAQLDEKHRETFWVKADAEFVGGTERFRYDLVVHTRKPNSHLFGALLDQSIITMDYTLSQKETRVRDHGYLFKIRPENVGLLFPAPVNYQLSSRPYSAPINQIGSKLDSLVAEAERPRRKSF